MIRELARGYWLTLWHIFKPRVTIEYPECRRETAERYRGVPALRRRPDGKERCVACALCVQICPARCIEMTTETGPDGKKRAVTYLLEVGRCLFCGLCAEVCPEEAIVLTRRYTLLLERREEGVLDKETLLANGEGTLT